jgi:flagellar basal body-associated protein FliL
LIEQILGGIKMAQKEGKSNFNQVFFTLIICLAIFFAAVFAATMFFIKQVLPDRNQFTTVRGNGNSVKYLVPLEEPLVINLADPGNRRYIKLNMTIAVDAEETQAEIVKRGPQIRDLIITVFRAKTASEISEKEGYDSLRNELIIAITEFLSAGKVVDIFFTEFLIT